MTSSESPEGWEPRMHHFVDGEWVMTYETAEGVTVDADGNGIDLAGSYVPERYVRTIVVDGQRFHERETADDGVGRWYDDAGNAVSVDPTEAELLARPGEIYVHDGEIYRAHPTEVGVDIIVDAAGNEADLSAAQLREELELPTFSGFVQYGRRQAVVGIDGDGETRLYTVQGEPIDGPIPWDDIDRVDPGPLSGDPVAIGDYAMEHGGTERVYLFRDGSQATRNADGSYERVIVPTDIEYPRGHPFFEGNIETGGDGLASAPMEVFSFADGQTAYRIDGELILMDLPLDVTHPGEAPVACGPFPGGDLFVFADGRQLVHRFDGTWAIGDLPDLPPFDDLAATYGEPEPIDLANVPEPLPGPLQSAPVDDLFDDITGVGGITDQGGIDAIVEPEHGVDLGEPSVPLIERPLGAVGGAPGVDPPLPDIDLASIAEPPAIFPDDVDETVADTDPADDGGVLE